MDPNYRASEDHWRFIENWPGIHSEYPGASCLLELRARIEALEAAQQLADHIPDATKMVAPPAPADGLVKRVAKAMYDAPHPPGDWKPEARAAIRAVGEWLEGQRGADACYYGGLLREEAER